MHVIHTHFNPAPVVFEENTGESCVDKALYVPTKLRIEQFIRSGENLEDLRRLQYHSDMLERAEDIENFDDPLLYRGHDITDYQLLHKQAIEEIMSRRNSGLSPAPSDGAEKNSPESEGDGGKPEVNTAKESEIAPNAVEDK